jgi:hypothetical protein
MKPYDKQEEMNEIDRIWKENEHKKFQNSNEQNQHEEGMTTHNPTKNTVEKKQTNSQDDDC